LRPIGQVAACKGFTGTIGAVGKRGAEREKLTVQALGEWVRTVRRARKMTQRAVEAKTGLRHEQVSRLENGANVEVEQYERIAHAMGFRNALEMFRAPSDPIMRRLTRYWQLLDDGARRDVLAQVKGMIDADEESSAIAGEE
jgi:transcriptional regulator with XRE-family HTH domain